MYENSEKVELTTTSVFFHKTGQAKYKIIKIIAEAPS